MQNRILSNNGFRGTGKILVMDDDEVIRMTSSVILHQLGYDVIITSKGEDAVQEFTAAFKSDHPFDAVILDLTVAGGMGGIETIQELRMIDPAVCSIVSSGYSEDKVLDKPESYGFNSGIAKPYTIKEISSVLSEALKKKPPSGTEKES